MPSLQTALPPELANNAIRLYRECLRRAKFIVHRQHNTELVVHMARQQFKKHMDETDPKKVQKLKDDAASGLINHILYESENMSGRKFTPRVVTHLAWVYQLRLTENGERSQAVRFSSKLDEHYRCLIN